jgi:hypothetical protein
METSHENNDISHNDNIDRLSKNVFSCRLFYMTQSQTPEHRINNKLKRIWKEAAVAEERYHLSYVWTGSQE